MAIHFHLIGLFLIMAIWNEDIKDLLITLIQERPALYDITETKYSNRIVKTGSLSPKVNLVCPEPSAVTRLIWPFTVDTWPIQHVESAICRTQAIGPRNHSDQLFS